MASRSSVADAGQDHPELGGMRAPELRSRYRRIFIADSRQWFDAAALGYDPATDLVLTYDFGLRHDIEESGGDAFYVDQLIDPDTMQENNFLAYRFFSDWHRDADGADLFEHHGVPFGFAFRLEFWNDYIFLVRARLCLQRVASLDFETLYAGTELGLVESILRGMNAPFTALRRSAATSAAEYYFPIHRWMRANIRRAGLKALALNTFAWIIARLLSWSDQMRPRSTRRPSMFVQEYHPTVEIIRRLRREGRVRVVGASPSRNNLFARFLPLVPPSSRHARAASRLMSGYRARRSARLVLSNGIDVTDDAYRVIDERISPRVADSIRILDSAIAHVERDPFRLELLIANIGEIVTLVDCVCRARGIPSYLVINGLLGPAYADDSKHATVINGYSRSIREHYFRGMDNVVCLGDPRMDQYPPVPRRPVPTGRFTVTISASGHNPTDLNSYVAVEFDFMHDVLTALATLRDQGANVRVMIKVRANGYYEQYQRFTEEYFPGFVDEIIDAAPMRSVLRRTDCFISIYSQTLFEASCMGIPAVYYRVGDAFKDPPFDGRSELVTVQSVVELVQALEDYRAGHPRFDAFLDRAVMGKYMGPLDGGNVERNVAFIYELLDRERPRAAS